MNNFLIITNSLKDNNKAVAEKIQTIIKNKGASAVVKDCFNEETGNYCVLLKDELPENIECVISIGGDGTLLHCAKDLRALDVVFIGVNKGSLGFLAEITLDNIEFYIDKLINNEFNVESRMMLKGAVIRDGQEVYKSIVLNDIVVHRGSALTIADYDVFVNDHLLGKFQADGIILSTPTGSTAYNLSAGGPVARPDSKMIILTPLCSHSIGSRSVLLSENDKIEIHIMKSRRPVDEQRNIAFDGDGNFNLKTGDIIKIEKAEQKTKIAKIDESSFLQVIKDKLGD